MKYIGTFASVIVGIVLGLMLGYELFYQANGNTFSQEREKYPLLSPLRHMLDQKYFAINFSSLREKLNSIAEREQAEG